MTNNTHKRIKGTDQVGIFIGEDEEQRFSLLIVFTEKPKVTVNSNVILSSVRLRKDRDWALEISLLDENYRGVFQILIDDLVSVVLPEKNQLFAERKILKRYNEWTQLFEEFRENRLSYPMMQGLAGELFFINNVLTKHYEIEDIIKAWIGPNGGNQDFHFSDNWYEVKTKSRNKNSVTISNDFQLNATSDGDLVVIDCEKTSINNAKGVNIMDLYESIADKIYDQQTLHNYNKKLYNLKFVPSEEYREPNFLISKIVHYNITEEFPKLIETPNLNAFHNIKFDVSLPAIKQFISKEVDLNDL
ncbi:PD-(D/E)XK motif protein [Ruoffia tabacinasalis]|uniref:PD-(D/E)XK motif protein n=1 Tax=Ruoffia tabacinasalis TaxID=87458 RepID=A0ABS0LHN0_9LACT|nr:PD-(D/E)XK motif protein [Ruoffia tabacinasalis]MBG9977796.1 PD-(D/E)XK motif protein [Ruoffia tabacinasalis]